MRSLCCRFPPPKFLIEQAAVTINLVQTMAENLDDGEFWLPSHFLTDDDILMDFTDYGCHGYKVHQQKKDVFDGLESFRPGGFGNFGFGSTGHNSDLSSPVESVNGSTETESDEDSEFLLSGLTHQLARSALEDSFSLSNKNPTLSTSPQSTLCSVGGGGVIGGCGCNNESSSRGSPTCPVSPPPLSMNSRQNDAALNLLCAAADDLAKRWKMRTEGGTGFFDSSNREALLSGAFASRKPSPVCPLSVGGKEPNASAKYHGFYPRQAYYQHQLQPSQIQQLRQQQMLHHQRLGVWEHRHHQPQPKSNVGHSSQLSQNREFVRGGRNVSNGNNNIHSRSQNLSSSVWPPLQQRNMNQLNQQPQRPVPGSSGMQAVFLGTPGSKRECAGTGVFLPRRVGGVTNELRKKPDGPMRFRAGGIGPQRKNSNRAQTAGEVAAPQTNYEIQLPQEWTY